MLPSPVCDLDAAEKLQDRSLIRHTGVSPFLTSSDHQSRIQASKFTTGDGLSNPNLDSQTSNPAFETTRSLILRTRVGPRSSCWRDRGRKEYYYCLKILEGAHKYFDLYSAQT